MSEDKETSPTVEEQKTGSPSESRQDVTLDGPVPRPKGWMYKGFNIFGKELWYASPWTQLLMVSLVCFLCPGMFNALGGMGGMGLDETHTAAQANTAVYSTFAITAFFAGSIANVLGLRVTLGLGGIGYCVYVASFLSYAHTKNEGFVIFAGSLLGVCAGLLWTAQGAIMMSYPPEREKGRFISWFWVIFNLGAVIGSLIPLAQNINNKDSRVNDGTYAAFLVLTFLGATLSFFLANAKHVIREDGSKVILMKNPTWKTEIVGLWETFRNDPWIVLLFPLFWSSNTFYTYQFNNMNGSHFSTRARALNSVLYWLAQIIGALVMGYALDIPTVRRSVRAKGALVALFALTMAIWGGGWAWQKDRATREEVLAKENRLYDWNDGGEEFIGPMFLYFFYGMYDAIWQTSIYWYMGALSNSGRKAANLAGFYKGIQSAGAAVWWALDERGVAFNSIFGATWGTLAGSLIVAAPVLWIKIKDTVPVEEDLKFSDETIHDVVAPGTVDKKEAAA